MESDEGTMTKIIPFYLGTNKAEALIKFIERPTLQKHGIPSHFVVTGEGPTRQAKYVPCQVQCPHCDAGDKARCKVFIPVWDMADKCVKFWERGFFNWLEIDHVIGNSPYKDLDLSTQVFKIVRLGEKFDPSTRYTVTLLKEKDTFTDYGDIPSALEVFQAFYGEK